MNGMLAFASRLCVYQPLDLDARVGRGSTRSPPLCYQPGVVILPRNTWRRAVRKHRDFDDLPCFRHHV